MKTIKFFNIFLTLVFLALLAFTQKANATANLQGLNTRYLIWHRFNEVPPVDAVQFEVTNLGEYIISPYPFDYDDALSLSNTQYAVYKYNITTLDSSGWYILQIDGDYKVEMSTDNATWTTVLAASEVANWTNKYKCESPFYIDLKQFLPSDNLYVKISDNNLSVTDGVIAYNALITENSYPCAYGGDQDPVTAHSVRKPGDVQFLFIKNHCGTAGANSRFADGNYPGINGSSNFFVYKFDLPDDNDDCVFNAYIANEFDLVISTNWDFSDVFYSTQSVDKSPVVKITVNLKELLENTDDNVVYFKMGDADCSDGWGGMIKRFWISPQISAAGASFDPSGEEEIPFLNDVSDSLGYWTPNHFWFADTTSYVEYRFNLGPDVTDYSHIIIDTAQGYLWQGSSNGIDWVDLFIGPDGGPAQTLTIYPLTGKLDGEGAQSTVGNLMNPSYEGWSNVFFLKLSDVTPEGGNGGQMKKMQINITPPPAINTIYPVWHYFDTTEKFTSDRIGGVYYKNSGGGGQTGPSPSRPNRGNGTPGRMGMFMDGSAYAIMKYPMDITDEQGWYVIQVESQYSIELSNDGTTWTTAFTPDPSLLSPATHSLNWTDKGITNMSPYYFDLADLGLLPTSNIYVRLADAETSGGWGSLGWNALITKLGYPCFFAGGNEPDTSGLIGDQQFLFTKNTSSDRENNGRFADGATTFSYKFDLPDGTDDCTLHTRIAGNYLMIVSTNYLVATLTTNYPLSTADLVISNTTGDAQTNFNLNIDLSSVLAETVDNIIYVYFADLTTSNGWGPNVMDFWITKHQILTQALVNAATEKELPFLWQSTRSQVDTPLSGSSSRQVLSGESFVYLFNITNIGDAIAYNFEVGNEYTIDVSTNTVDWYNIFNAITNEAKNGVSYNPYTAETIGVGAVSNVPAFYIIGNTENKIYFRFRDSIGGDEIPCSVYKAWTGDAIPEPGLVFGLILAFTALIKRKVK